MLPARFRSPVTRRRVEWDLGISQAASPRRLRRPLPRPRAIRWVRGLVSPSADIFSSRASWAATWL